MIETSRESGLVDRIRTPVPSEKKRRYARLIEKRDDQELSEAEHAELLDLTAEMENLDADRLETMAELAELRRIPLIDVIREFASNRRSA